MPKQLPTKLIGYTIITITLLLAINYWSGKTTPPPAKPLQSKLTTTTPDLDTRKRVTTNSPLKDITLKSLNSDPIAFNTSSKKLYIINFWATWCGPCVEEIPYLISAYSNHKDTTEIIGISMDKKESTVKRFLNKTPINYPIAMTTKEIGSIFGTIDSIPTTYFLDENLDLIFKIRGSRPKSYWTNTIKNLTQ